MGKIRGAVKRIHVPAELLVEALAGSLFAVDAMVRKGLAEPCSEKFFDRAVGDGNEVDIALVLSLDATGQVLAQARASLPGNGRGGRNED